MVPSPLLVAEAQVPLADPAGMLTKLCDHFESHGTVTRTADHGIITGPFGQALLTATPDMLHCRVECGSQSSLSIAKMVVADHLFQFADDAHPAFAWTGDTDAGARLPYFQAVTVRHAFALTPRMRRVVVAGEVQRLSKGGLHVRVLIPPAGRVPRWPTAQADGRVLWPEGADALTPRVYTLRHLDPDTGEAAIDVALHEGAAPGSDWARTAAPGSVVGLMGPGGGDLPAADWYLFAGDETALPAIARMLEALPAGTRAVARIEVADAAEEQIIRTAADLDLTWLHRDGAPAGTSPALAAAVEAVHLPPDAARPYVWAACEQATARTIRAGLAARGLCKTRRSVAAYWRRGYQGVDIGE